MKKQELTTQSLLEKYAAGERDFNNVVIHGCFLTYTELRDINLSGADLRDANFASCNLSGANLSGATVSGANLSGTNFSGANLKKVYGI